MENKILEIALPIIKAYEGCHLKAYKCPADVWTIGWGQTGPDIKEGLVWTQKQADDALEESVKDFLSAVLKLIKVRVRPEQVAALVSFAYNTGIGNLSKSTLLRLINEGRSVDEVLPQFLVWSKGGGKTLLGLLLRRASEAVVFKGGSFIRFKSIEEASQHIKIPHELHPQKEEAKPAVKADSKPAPTPKPVPTPVPTPKVKKK